MFDQLLKVHRFAHLETVITDREWLVDRFQGLVDFPGCRASVERVTTRLALRNAYRDQLAHFAQSN